MAVDDDRKTGAFALDKRCRQQVAADGLNDVLCQLAAVGRFDETVSAMSGCVAPRLGSFTTGGVVNNLIDETPEVFALGEPRLAVKDGPARRKGYGQAAILQRETTMS